MSNCCMRRPAKFHVDSSVRFWAIANIREGGVKRPPPGQARVNLYFVRDAEPGGGGSVGNLRPNLETVGNRPPPTLVRIVNIKGGYFWPSREVGSFPKILGQIRGVFSFG